MNRIHSKFILPSLLIVLAAVVFIVFMVFPQNDSVATVNGVKIKADLYRYALIMAKEEALAKHPDIKASDLWNYRSSENSPTYGNELEEYELEKLINTALINDRFRQLELTLTDAQNELRKKNLADRIEDLGGMDKAKQHFARYYITYDDFAGFYEDYDRYELLFLHYFGADGEYPVNFNEIDAYYAENYARIKSVFIPADNNSAAENLAAQVENKAKEAENDNFDALITQYNKDKGMDSNPNGYIITKKYDDVAEYKDAAFAMQVGDIRTVLTDDGYYVMKKYSSTDPSVYTASDRQRALLEMKSRDFYRLVSNDEAFSNVKRNEKLLEKIKIETITYK